MDVTIEQQGLFGTIEAKVTIWGVRKDVPVKKSAIAEASQAIGKRFSERLDATFPSLRGRASSYGATREFSSNGMQVSIHTTVSFNGSVGMTCALDEIGKFDVVIMELLVDYIDHAARPTTLTSEIELVLAAV